MKPTTDQIELMDKMLQFCANRNEGRIKGPSLLAKELNISEDLSEFLFNKVCEIGHDENILVSHKTGYGIYNLVSLNYFETENFINNGGFQAYFSTNDPIEEPSNTIINFNNSGIIGSMVHSVGDKTVINSTNEDSNKLKYTNWSKKSLLERSSWIAGILGAIAAIISLFLYLKN